MKGRCHYLHITHADSKTGSEIVEFRSCLVTTTRHCKLERTKIHFVLGSSTVGEYFDPALDCSDVVDRVPDAADGFYWLNSETIQNVSKVSYILLYFSSQTN